MTSARKKSEGVCDKCARQPDCEYKAAEVTLVLLRCLDFSAKENSKEEK